MRAFSLDLRSRVLADYQAGLSFAELGRKYSTRAEWVRRFIRRYDSTGEIAARPPLNHRVPCYRRHEAERRARPWPRTRASRSMACAPRWASPAT